MLGDWKKSETRILGKRKQQKKEYSIGQEVFSMEQMIKESVRKITLNDNFHDDFENF
jgi:hypothetical protein